MFTSPVSQRRVLVGKTSYSMSMIRIEFGQLVVLDPQGSTGATREATPDLRGTGQGRDPVMC